MMGSGDADSQIRDDSLFPWHQVSLKTVSYETSGEKKFLRPQDMIEGFVSPIP